MVERFVLDTSAIFALTDDEAGADRVERLLERAEAGGTELLAATPSLMELYYVALQRQGDDVAAHLVTLVKAWPLRWVTPGEPELLLGARFKAHHRLSFADALIAAVAATHQATLVHKDPEFEALAAEVRLQALPYKQRP